MKKLNLFLFTMLISTVLFAQKLAVNDVPAQAMNDFKNRFPAAEKTIWEKNDVILKVNFLNDGNKIEVAYQNNNWQETKWGIATEYAPKKIKDYTLQYYPAYKIKELFFVDKSSGERVYEVVIAKKKKDSMTLIFDSSSSFLRIMEEIKKAAVEVKK